MVQIESGGVDGSFKARVDKRNSLHTRAMTLSKEHIICMEDQETYVASTSDTFDTLTLGAGTTTNLVYMENTSNTQTFILHKLLVSPDLPGLLVFVIVNMVLDEDTLANNTPHTPVNTNAKSDKPADVLVHVWDEVGATGILGLSGGKKIGPTQLPAFAPPIDVDGFLVMSRSKSLVVQLVNPTGGPIEVASTIRFYMEEDGK